MGDFGKVAGMRWELVRLGSRGWYDERGGEGLEVEGE